MLTLAESYNYEQSIVKFLNLNSISSPQNNNPISMTKQYEGKAKVIFSTDDPMVLLTYFKDDATAYNAMKRGNIPGKGEMNCTISSHLFQYLQLNGIANHFIAQPSKREMRVQALRILPLEVVVRNIAAGSLCSQTGIEPGTNLPFPLVEFYYKRDDLGDPLLTLDRLQLLNLATSEQVNYLKSNALHINQLLGDFFDSCGLTLVDFKLEFGLNHEQQLLLGDEISPDTCRLWDQGETDADKRILDKDRFRKDLGSVLEAYEEVLTRVKTQCLRLLPVQSQSDITSG